MAGNMHDFTDKAILVTGSTRGIGRAIALHLSTMGAIVGVHGRNAANVEKACMSSTFGDKAVPLPFDLDNPENAAEMILAFHKQAGAINGLVNNAGGGKAAPFRSLTLDNWRRIFRTNLESAMIASREAYILMRNSGCGGIVNIASIAAHGPGKWMGADYAASKAGLVSMTKSLAFEAARFGVRVNAVSPGMVNTDMTAILPDHMRDSLAIPLKRFAEPGEIAAPVAWLLSDESSYLTGEVLRVDGGLFM
jgi:3-oxoacyl-[acyl-carrier protein] reductase